jgi:beta-lactamase superfamily II metal-dependent hydrolase
VNGRTRLGPSLAGTDRTSPPASDELEISLLGPGFGESVVAHLGDGAWMIVDSCVVRGEAKALPLEYLAAIGVDPAKQVQLVVASHWDDDHIRGLMQVIRTCKKARLAFSSAYTEKDFLTIVGAFEPGSMRRRSGVREVWEIYDYLKREKTRKVRHAHVDQTLWVRHEEPRCEVTALSPSDADEQTSIEDFRASYAEAIANGTREFFSTVEPNASSVVLWIAVGDIRILLGADLEVGNDASRGWSAVLNADEWQGSLASVVKIPHHGSATADSVGMWSSMLVPHPVGAVSPFIGGRHRIPSSAERAAIRGHTSRGYLTRDPDAPIVGLSPVSVQTFAEAAKRFTIVDAPAGHVRARGRTNDPASWTVELFAGALAV